MTIRTCQSRTRKQYIYGLIFIVTVALASFELQANAKNSYGHSIFAGVPTGVIWDVETYNELIFLAAENGVFLIIGEYSQRIDYNQVHSRTGIISDVSYDTKGYLWVAEYGVGVFRYNLQTGTSEEFITPSVSLENVWNFELIGEYALFSLTDGLYIVSLTTGELQIWAREVFPGNLNDAYFLAAENESIGFAISRDYLVRFHLDSKKLHLEKIEDYYSNLSSLTAIESKSGKLYLGGPEGVYILGLEKKYKQFVPFNDYTSVKKAISKIFVSESGEVWIAAGGLFKIKNDEIVPVNWMNPLLTSESIHSIISINELNNNEIIFSSSQLGLIALASSQKSINYLSLDGAIYQKNIRGIGFIQERESYLKDDELLYKIDVETGYLTIIENIKENGCLDFEYILFENLYGTYDKDIKFCEGEYNRIIEAENGLLYAYMKVAEEWKYFIYDKEAIKDDFPAPARLKNSITLSSGELVGYDENSNVHIQLSKFNWKEFSSDLNGWRKISCIIELNSELLLCTSGSGLQEMDISTGTFSQSDIFEDYDIRFVRAALVSKSNILWLATNMGLYLYDVGSDNLYPLDKSSGVFDVDFEYSGIYEIDGTIVVVGDRYTYTINEKLLLETLRQEKNHSKTVSIFNVDWTSKKGEFQRYSPIFSSSPLSIGSAYDSLNIKVASSSYLNSYKQNIEFRIMGYIDDWQRHEGSHATITISDIGYGDFEFQSRVSNKSGVNENPIASLTFSINSPFYRSYYAYCIYILLAITLIILFKMGHVGKFAIFIKNTSAIQFFLGRYSNKSKNKVEELAKHRIRMFSNISHELRSPLQIIKNTLEHINNSNGLAENINVGSITANAKKMEALLDQVNEVDRLGECSVNSFKHYSMKDLKHIAISLNSIAKNKRLNLEVKVKGDKTISLLKGSLESIVSILIKNALERAKEGGDIKLIAVINDENLSITITDNGSVIETSSHHKFFSRNHITAQSGLKNGQVQDVALVKELIMINQGAITFESAKAKGTKFFITLPLDDAEEINSQFSENKGWDEKPTILLVDDSREIRNYLFTLLSSNYQCLVARDGRQALDILKNYDVSLIITELTMPIMNGFDFIGKLQQSSYLQRIPVIVLTANVDEKSKERVLSTNVSALLTKPVTDNELELRVKHLVSIGDIAVSNKDEEGLEKSVNSFIALPELTTEKDMAFYLNFISVLENNYSNEAFNREKAASELLISVRSLNRRLSELFEYNFSEFLIRFRVDKASDILAGGASVMETCVAVGFGTPSYFSTSFKRIVGVTPRSYASTVGATKKGATESRK